MCQNIGDSGHLYQLVCSDSHKLLQPWPSKCVNEDSEQIDNSEKNERKVNTGRDSDGSGRNEESIHGDDDNMLLSEEEARALADVEDILNKAQQARKLQAKVNIVCVHCRPHIN